MPTSYAGNGSTPFATQPWVRIAIVSTTAGTPIAVNAPGHGFNSGDTVEQDGCSDAAANGVFQITRIDANNYFLNGSTSASSGTGGTAVDMQVQPALVLPAAGEKVSAVTSNPPIERSADFVPFLYQRCGEMRIQHIEPAFGTSGYSSVNNTAAASYVSAAGVNLLDPPTVPDPLIATDILEIDVSINVWELLADPSSTITASYTIGISLDGGAFTALDASSVTRETSLDGTSFNQSDVPLFMKGFVRGVTGVYTIGLMYKLSASLTVSGHNQVHGPFTLVAKHWRAN